MGNSTCCAPSKNQFGFEARPATAELRKKDPFAHLEGYIPGENELERDQLDTYNRSNGSSGEVDRNKAFDHRQSPRMSDGQASYASKEERVAS